MRDSTGRLCNIKSGRLLQFLSSFPFFVDAYNLQTLRLKKKDVMKNKHVLLKIKETKYCSVCCHALELSNFKTILNSKAQVDPILAEHIATM